MKLNREIIIKSLLDSKEFEDIGKQLVFIQSLHYFLDKYKFEKFINTQHITYKEYKKYFKPIFKELAPHTHKQNKKQIKRMEKSK